MRYKIFNLNIMRNSIINENVYFVLFNLLNFELFCKNF